MKINLKKSGFTLSEIMVTLTLIGCLATLTLSTIGASVQQRARLAEFRSAFAKMDAALKSIEYDRGSIYACYTNEIDMNDATEYGWRINGIPAQPARTECPQFLHAFTRAMGATHSCETNPRQEGCIPANYPAPRQNCILDFKNAKRAYVFDNSMILLTYYHPDGQWFARRMAIDINGRKGPNKCGQDIFPFSLTPTETVTVNGKIYVKDVRFTSLQDGRDDVYRKCYIDGAGRTTKEMMKESAGFR